MKGDPLVVHASHHDECLARFHAEVVDGVDSAGTAAHVGTAVHRVAEAIAYAVAESPAVDQREIAARVFKSEVRRLAIPPAGVVDGLSMLDRNLAFDSRIQLHGEAGWNARPEVKWALDLDLEPFSWRLDPVTGEGSWVDDDGVECPQDRVLAAGTIDLLEWTPDATTGRITDWKTVRAFRDAEDAYEDWQLRLYAFAMFKAWPAMRTIEARFGMLRHGYFARADFLRDDPWQWSTETRLFAIREQRERAVASNQWPETLGPWCAYCPLIHRCAVMREAREQGGVPEDLPRDEVIRRWKALSRLADEYEELARAPFQDPFHDAPVPLGDAKGSAFGWKDTNAWTLVRDYEGTMEAVRQFVPDDAWPTVFAENFRFVTESNLPGRVAKVLKDLRVTEDVRDRVVLPLTKPMLTTFRPDIQRVAETLTAEQVDELVDRMFDAD